MPEATAIAPGVELRQLFRFALVGAANTLIGGCVILLLQGPFRWSPALANAGGFAIGLTIAFLLNRSFVFRAAGARSSQAMRFLVTVVVAFGLNELVLSLAVAPSRAVTGSTIAAQMAAMATYTVVNFVLCRFWVFRREPDATL